MDAKWSGTINSPSREKTSSIALPHARVRRDAAYEGQGLLYLLAFRYVAFKVAGQCKAEPGDQLVVGCSYLLQVDHVGFRENRAPPRDPRRDSSISGRPAANSSMVKPRRDACWSRKEPVPAAQRVFIEKSFIAQPFALPVHLEYDELGVFPADIYGASYMREKVMKSLS